MIRNVRIWRFGIVNERPVVKIRPRMRRPLRPLPARGAPALSAKEQTLNDWRGVNIVALEKTKLRARAASDVMRKVLVDLRIDQRQAEAEIARVWKNLVDPTVAAHAQPSGLHKGTLFVQVDTSVWLDEIVRYRRHEILERLQHSFGKEMIKRISFRLG